LVGSVWSGGFRFPIGVMVEIAPTSIGDCENTALPGTTPAPLELELGPLAVGPAGVPLPPQAAISAARPAAIAWARYCLPGIIISRRASHRDQPASHHDRAVDLLERVHDLRVVRAPSQPQHPTLVHRGDRELGHRVLRIHAAGAC